MGHVPEQHRTREKISKVIKLRVPQVRSIKTMLSSQNLQNSRHVLVTPAARCANTHQTDHLVKRHHNAVCVCALTHGVTEKLLHNWPRKCHAHGNRLPFKILQQCYVSQGRQLASTAAAASGPAVTMKQALSTPSWERQPSWVPSAWQQPSWAPAHVNILYEQQR